MDQSKYRKYVCAAIFHKDKVLIFHRYRNWRGWELMKGGVKKGERIIDAAKREIKEETGHNKFKLKRTKYMFKYKWPRSFIKDGYKYYGGENRLFIVELPNENVKIDRYEHTEYKWVSSEEALRLLTFNNHKKALKYALKVRK
ncbi:MAG: NUDIX hydrolase [Candidatus Aenigmarchaeota archaeon]|nr:NUDIX hydrolase [Candidatus Aenigmarchaeota archaeon]